MSLAPPSFPPTKPPFWSKVRVLGTTVAAVVAILGFGASVVTGLVDPSSWLQKDNTDVPPGGISIDGDVIQSCIQTGDNSSCNPADLTPDQEAWTNLLRFDGPPPTWDILETWETIADVVFASGDRIELAPDEQLESGSASRTPDGFLLEFSDTLTVTAFLPTWPGQLTPPYYAAITVRQVGGPVETRACGLLFNGKPSDDYSDPNDRWLIVKVAGGDVEITQWTDLTDAGEINHRRFERFANVVSADTEHRLEVLVEENRWTAAVDGRVVGWRSASLGTAFAFPAGQQETTARRGNVVCDFEGWEVRAPAR